LFSSFVLLLRNENLFCLLVASAKKICTTEYQSDPASSTSEPGTFESVGQLRSFSEKPSSDDDDVEKPPTSLTTPFPKPTHWIPPPSLSRLCRHHSPPQPSPDPAHGAIAAPPLLILLLTNEIFNSDKMNWIE
jgi:hypothetical protein